MDDRRFILCGGQAPSKESGDAEVLRLNAWAKNGSDDYVGLKIADLHQSLLKCVPAQFEDLIDIATYVYCADQATTRGGQDVDNFGRSWRRRFHFHIPVREPDLWNGDEMKQTLIETLSFLSDDYYEFTFTRAKNAPSQQNYFEGLNDDDPRGKFEQVVMFSGGLDSLAGAVEEAVQSKRRVMLVTHRPTPKLNNFQARLEQMLAEKAGAFAPTHLHVRINKKRELNKSYLQRARSFLYVSIGATVAEMLGLRSVRFYENGVVSLNLPVAAQVIGARATRTTHPKVLDGFAKVMSLVSGKAFAVENPFLWETKGEVISRILRADCGELIGASSSCAHTFSFSNEHPHCGTCSQCIDRRFGVIAAKAEEFDNAKGYANDVFVGTRPNDEDRMMLALYLERSKKFGKIKSGAELIASFPEVARTLQYLGDSTLAGAEKILALHKRHGTEVRNVLKQMIVRHSEAIADHDLPADCLLTIAYDSGHAEARVEPEKKVYEEEQEERWEKTEESEKTYRLRRSAGGFVLVFKGKTEILPKERGVELIEYLLKNPPDEPIHAVELEARVDGIGNSGNFRSREFGAGEMSEMSEQGMTIEATGKKLMGGNVSPVLAKKLSELRATKDDEGLPQWERDDAESELLALLKDFKKGGKISSQAGRIADRVRKAMKGVIDKLKKEEIRRGEPNQTLREFGAHLEEHLWFPSMGGPKRKGAAGKAACYTYQRPTGVIWRD